MAKVKVKDKQRIAGHREVDAEVEAIRSVSRSIGRAISLAVIAANASPAMEDHAIEKLDAAWTELADKLIEFASN